MLIATQAGQDSDCNPSSALGILGVVLGYHDIPAKFTAGISAIADEKFNYTFYSLNDIVDSTVMRAIALVERSGGSVGNGLVKVKVQDPRQAPLEVWDNYGAVKEQIFFDDNRWQWTGNWQRTAMKIWRYERISNISGERNAVATISFAGTGAAVTGILLPNGGKAEVYLDGTLSQTIDVYPDEPDAKSRESIWHAFGLENKRHELRIVVLGQSFSTSQGSDISITSLLVFE